MAKNEPQPSHFFQRHPALTSSLATLLITLSLVFLGSSVYDSRGKEEKVNQYLSRAKRLLHSFSAIQASKLDTSRPTKTSGPENKKNEEKRQDSIETYMEASVLLESALVELPGNYEIKNALFQIYREIGLLAMGGKNFMLSKVAFTRCKNIGNRDEAERWLSLLEEKKKTHFEIDSSLFVQVKSHLQREEVEDAIIFLVASNDLGRDFANACLSRGKIREKKGDKEGAVFDYKMATRFDPNLADAHNRLGYLWMGSERIEPALSEYNKAIALDSTNPEFYCNLGEALKTKGDMEGAMSNYNKAIELNERYARGYCGRGIVWMHKGQAENAVPDFEKAIELDPRYAEAYNGRANTKKEKKDFQGALADYAKALEADPGFAWAYYNRAIIYVKQGKSKEADEDFLKFVKLAPNTPEASTIRNYLKDRGKLERQ